MMFSLWFLDLSQAVIPLKLEKSLNICSRDPLLIMAQYSQSFKLGCWFQLSRSLLLTYSCLVHGSLFGNCVLISSNFNVQCILHNIVLQTSSNLMVPCIFTDKETDMCTVHGNTGALFHRDCIHNNESIGK